MAPEKPRVSIALLPPTDDLVRLSPQKVQMVVDAVSRDGEQKLRYASLGMICGTICLLGALAATSYLAATGHDKMAAAILCTSVLSLIGKIFLQRLG